MKIWLTSANKEFLNANDIEQFYKKGTVNMHLRKQRSWKKELTVSTPNNRYKQSEIICAKNLNPLGNSDSVSFFFLAK